MSTTGEGRPQRADMVEGGADEQRHTHADPTVMAVGLATPLMGSGLVHGLLFFFCFLFYFWRQVIWISAGMDM